MPGKSLNHQQMAFCAYYAADPEKNATRAAIEAGYGKKSAASKGSQLLRNVKVKAEIDRRTAKQEARIELGSDDVIRELWLLAKADLSAAYDDRGNLKPIHEIPEATRRAMAGIEVFEEYEGHGDERVHTGDVRKVKFWDKTKALELLGKHHKLFTDKIDVSGKLTLEQLLQQGEE